MGVEVDVDVDEEVDMDVPVDVPVDVAEDEDCWDITARDAANAVSAARLADCLAPSVGVSIAGI